MNQILDFANSLGGGLSQPPKSLTGNTNGVGLDLQNGLTRTQGIASAGVLTDNATFYVQFQESADNTTFSDIADANANTGTINTANSQVVKSFQRTMRYVRGKIVFNGGGGNAAALIEVSVFEQKQYLGGSGISRSPSS